MQPLPNEARTRNVTAKERCDWCLNDGTLVVATRPSRDPDSPFEMMGPCPYCERGFAVEFPEGRPGPWGVDGYWQGRSPDEVRSLQKMGGSKPLSILANRERLEQLMAEMEEKRLARERAEEERRAAERAARAAEDSQGEVGDLAKTGSASDGDVVAPGEGEGDAATVAAERDPLPVPPPAESTGLFE